MKTLLKIIYTKRVRAKETANGAEQPWHEPTYNQFQRKAHLRA